MTTPIFSSKQYILLLTTALLIAPLQAHAVATKTTPSGENVIAGSATFSRPAAGQLNVNQTSNRAVIEWDRFDIGKDASTEFIQPNSSALAVNRVTGVKSDPTRILGALKSNGRLMVLDKNGVFFGNSAQIDVGGIVASTGDVGTTDVMDGNDQIKVFGATNGIVENRGTISVADAGLAAFVAPIVQNSGTINVKFGRVSLASGSQSTVDLSGDNLIELAVDSELERALIENRGDILAEAGSVQLTTQVAKDILDNSINMSGLIDVSSIEQAAGKIVLSGAQDTTIKGDLLANSMAGGGDISVTAKDIGIGKNADIETNTTFTGDGGTIELIAENSINSLGDIRANGEEAGGFVTVRAGDNINLAGNVLQARATGVSNGGIIKVSNGGDEIRIASNVNANGIDGAGTIDVDAANSLNLTKHGRLESRTLSTGPGGTINLKSGSDAKLDGSMDVSGKEGGGVIEVSSGGNLAVNGKIIGIGEVIGSGAKVLMKADRDVDLTNRIDVSGISSGGEVEVSGQNVTATKTSRIYARGLETDLPEITENLGGSVTFNAEDAATAAGLINVNSYNGEAGNVELNGKNVIVTGTIRSNAENEGDGGTVQLNGTDNNQFSGRIYARGGPVAGDGGLVEFAQPNTIAPGSVVSVSASNGSAGIFNH